MESFDSNIRRQPGRYLAQVALATVALFAVLWVEQVLVGPDIAQAVLVGAIASTAFILFISPHRPAAMPRRVLGGHAWAVVIATVSGIAFNYEWANSLPLLFPTQAAITVGLAMLTMAATNTEHAPAAGTALAIAGSGSDWRLVLFVASSVIILAGVHWLVRDRLIDLY